MFQFILKSLILVAICMSTLTIRAQNVPVYSEIEIYSIDKNLVKILNDHGLEIDHCRFERETIVVNIREDKIFVLDELKLNYTVVIADLAKSIAANNSDTGFFKSVTDFENFDLGNFGNYHSYEEMIESIELMETLFPDQVKISDIGHSYEGRIIYSVKISDNVNIDESEEEGVAYFDALTHAREPNGLFSTLYFMWYLLEKQDTDPEMKYLIQNRELYFVPVVNPDGYVYNQTTNPDGGGLWRKNRAVIDGSSCVGVDLNRNFGVLWGVASGNNPCDETYRGIKAFSELESQAVRNLIDSIKPNTAFSSHAFGRIMIHPQEGIKGPGNDIHREYGSEFSPNSYFGYGEAIDILGANATGVTIEYLAEKHNCVAYSPEIGTSFWESASAIWENAEKMFPAFKFMAYGAGEFSVFHDFRLTEDTPILAGNSNAIEVRLFNRGMDFSAHDVSAEITCDHPAIEIVNSEVDYGTISSRTFKSNDDNLFQINIGEGLIAGEAINFNIEVSQNGGFSYSDTLTIYAGEIITLFSDNGESNSLDNWETNSWGITDKDSFDGSYCFTDSPEANYDSSTDTYIRMTNSIDLSSTQNPWVLFNAKWSFGNPDNTQLNISTDGGVTWGNISGASSFLATEHWQQLKVDLSEYANESDVRLGFNLLSNYWRNSDGFYFDTFRIIDVIDPNQASSISEQNEFMDEISIYPNPTSDYIFINFKDNYRHSYDVRIIDANRKIVYRQLSVSEQNLSIPVHNLSSGRYSVVVKLDSKVAYKAFVKN
jgi:hypothetical protein